MSYRVKIDKRIGDKSSIARDGDSLSETVYKTAAETIGRGNLPQFIASLVLIHVKSNDGQPNDINEALNGLLDFHLNNDNSKARLEVNGTCSDVKPERYQRPRL